MQNLIKTYCIAVSILHANGTNLWLPFFRLKTHSQRIQLLWNFKNFGEPLNTVKRTGLTEFNANTLRNYVVVVIQKLINRSV